MLCFKELRKWLEENAPRLEGDFSDKDKKIYCCEYAIYIERERLHKSVDMLERVENDGM